MASRIDLSTAGVSVNYAVETSAGIRPTSQTGYTKLTGIKSISDLNPEPSTLETTTLDELEWRTYINGLKDPGGTVTLGANNTKAFHAEWKALIAASKTAAETGLMTWFAIVVPGLDDAFYFAGTPSTLGLSAIEVDSVLEIDAFISTSKIDGWQPKPTV